MLSSRQTGPGPVFADMPSVEQVFGFCLLYGAWAGHMSLVLLGAAMAGSACYGFTYLGGLAELSRRTSSSDRETEVCENSGSHDGAGPLLMRRIRCGCRSCQNVEQPHCMTVSNDSNRIFRYEHIVRSPRFAKENETGQERAGT